MRRNPDGSPNQFDLEKYCAELTRDREQVEIPSGSVADPSMRDMESLILKRRTPRILAPMSEAELIENLIHMDGSFSSVERLSKEEIRKRKRKLTRGSSSTILIPEKHDDV